MVSATISVSRRPAQSHSSASPCVTASQTGTKDRGTKDRGSNEWVDQALRGDAHPRRELIERLLVVVRSEVARVLRGYADRCHRDPRQDIADFVQETLLELFDHDGRELRRWDPSRGRSLESFVRLITRRLVARRLAGTRGNPWRDLPDDSGLESSDDSSTVEQLNGRRFLEQVLTELGGRRNDRDRDLFELIFVHGFEPAVVANRLGMTIGAVNAWAYRVRRTARRIHSHHGHGRTRPMSSVQPTTAVFPSVLS